MMNYLNRKPFLVFLLCLLGLLIVLFFRSLDPDRVLFSNDGPLGATKSSQASLPADFTGVWYDLNSIGFNGGSLFPSFTPVCLWILQPLFFAKFYVPLVLALCGLCAWFGFRQLKLSPLACFLAAMAAMLNTTYFSAAAWGVGQHVVAASMTFVAIGLLADRESGPLRRWLKVVLAGFAVGLGVMEGFDIGVLYSFVVGLYVVYQALTESGPMPRRAAQAFARLAVVSLCAGFLAFHAVSVLFGTQIQNVGKQSKEEHWSWATQWSLPKGEALSIIIPGLFGYRMDTPGGGSYWGRVGMDLSYDRHEADPEHTPPGHGMMRFAGGGNYVGILVALVGIWCAFQAFRKNSPFPYEQRRFLWLWGVLIFGSLLLAFGRFAPFYQMVHPLPYFSSMRNPAKFTHFVSLGFIYLFAYGVHLLDRRYLAASAASTPSPFQVWRSKAAKFDKLWVFGSLAAVGVAVVGWFIYSSSHNEMAKFLQTIQVREDLAHSVAEFSARQVGWFVFFFAISVALFVMVISGRFAGPRAKWAPILLGALVIVDMARANLPWIIYWDWKQKYASNPIIDFLREKPYEHRAARIPFPHPDQLSLVEQMYDIEWKQHHFQYYDIQSLDVVQMPRVAADLANFEQALFYDGRPTNIYRMTRRWELTNTRYFIGAAGFLDLLNTQVDPVQHRFRHAQRFEIEPKPGVISPTKLEELTAVPNPDGRYALFEFTGAQPRARLYTQWQVVANNDDALKEIAAPDFKPDQKVMVFGAPPSPAIASTATNSNTGTVEYAHYEPKRIVLRTKTDAPSLLLLNDKFDPQWNVTVDGKPETIFRANYIMRGVLVPSGAHEVQFRFQPPQTGLYVSLTAIIIGLGLVGFAVVTRPKPPTVEPVPGPGPKPRR